MAVPLEKLTEIDYDILEFIHNRKEASKAEIISKFQNHEATEFRLTNLTQQRTRLSSLGYYSVEIPNYVYELTKSQIKPHPYPPPPVFEEITGIGVYSLTNDGKKVIEDYLTNKRISLRKQRVEWLRYGITTLISIIALILSILAFMASTSSQNRTANDYHNQDMNSNSYEIIGREN